MKLLVGGVAGVDYDSFMLDSVFNLMRMKEIRTLPLDESVHAHEGGELFWNQRKSAVGEDLCIPGHYFGQAGGRL